MAGEISSSASPKPTHNRTSSSNSTGKATGGQRAGNKKAHAVGKHSRNTSYGRNLNKLGMARIPSEDQPKTQRPRSTCTPSGSPSAAHVRRNKSEVTLPRTASKVQIKKNQSAVALRRNESASRLKRLSRPTTPHEPRENEEAQLKGHAQPAFGFGSDDEEEDEDNWTEESASQSPTITRTGSMKGPRPDLGGFAMDRRKSSTTDAQTLRGESPRTPVADVQDQALLPISASTEPPDPKTITDKLLRRTSLTQLAPKLSAVSADTNSRMQSPANAESVDLNPPKEMPSTNSKSVSLQSQEQLIYTPKTTSAASGDSRDPSLKEGISRFLDPQAAASSSGRSGTNIHKAMGMLRAQGSRSRSPSPNPATASAPVGEGVRRAKSAGNLSSVDAPELVRSLSQEGEDQPDNVNGPISRPESVKPRTWIVSVDPFAHRRAGGNTQAKMDLWRTQAQAADAEPAAAGPPAPLMRSMHGGAAASGYLGVEERRIRMAEEAENELAFLRMFRNPTTESFYRVKRERRERKKKVNADQQSNLERGRKSAKGKEDQTQGARNINSLVQSHATAGTRSATDRTVAHDDGSKITGTSVASSGGTAVNGDGFESHTSSRRSVRFDIGADGLENDDGSDTGEAASLSNLLKSMWIGAEAEIDA